MRLAVLAILLALAACTATEPGTAAGKVAHNRREIPPGPGLLTGQAGSWTVYRR